MQNKTEIFDSFLGIDVGQAGSVSTLLQDGKVVSKLAFSMDILGYSELLDWLGFHQADPGRTLICLEHTGVYSEHLELISYGAGYHLWKVDSGRISHIQLGPDRAKSDPVDSKKIAEFCYRFRDQTVAHVPEKCEISQLKQLVQYRGQLVKMRVMALNQLHAYEQKVFQSVEIRDSRNGLIDQFSMQIQQVEDQIEALLQGDAKLKRMSTVLQSIPGIGPSTAHKLITVTQGFTRMNDPKKLAAHAGTAPYDNSSGTNTKWRKRRISQKADRSLKVLLTTAVMSVIKPGGYFHSYYQMLCKTPGRFKLQAINIIRNKLLKIAVTLVNKDQTFDRELFRNNCKSWQNNLTLP